MNEYFNFINDIITIYGQHRKNDPKAEKLIYERHHIKPRCMGGTDDMFNLVDLTPREHYIAHQLLAQLYPDEWKVVCAWHFMSVIHKDKYSPTPEEYEASRLAIIKSQGEEVYQINDNGEVVGIYYSAREAGRQIGTSASHIVECCNKDRHRVKGYFWQTAKDFMTNGFTHKSFVNGKKPNRTVEQYDFEGNYINTFSSFEEAGKAVGVTGSAIRACCSGRTKSSGGYKWKTID